MNESGKIIEFPSGGPKRPEAEGEEPKVIEIGRFVSDEEGFKVLVRCEMQEGIAVLEAAEGGEHLADELRERGITGLDNRMVFPKDGQKFFDALRLNFRTPYCYAREKYKE
jgi:hypothetical protein